MTTADDALDRLALCFSGDVHYQDDVATVRDELQRLREEVTQYREWGDGETAKALAAERELARLQEGLRRIANAVEAWDNDERPDEDFPFEADMDFVNFCGHVARALLTDSPPSFQGPTTIQTSNPFGTAKLASPPDGGGAK